MKLQFNANLNLLKNLVKTPRNERELIKHNIPCRRNCCEVLYNFQDDLHISQFMDGLSILYFVA